jgi:DNA-binding NarL/FixJ family response regulator
MTSVYLLVSDPIAARRIQGTLSAQPGIEVAGWGNTLAAARFQLARSRPGIVIADMHLPDGNASELFEAFSRSGEYGRPQTIVLTPQLDNPSLIGAIQAGADAYLIEHAMPQDLVDTVRLVMAGASPMDSTIAKRVQAHFDERVWDVTDYVGEAQSPLHLTDEERLLLERTAQGYGPGDIAKGQRTTAQVIGQRLRTIYRKMQLDLRAASLSLELA